MLTKDHTTECYQIMYEFIPSMQAFMDKQCHWGKLVEVTMFLLGSQVDHVQALQHTKLAMIITDSFAYQINSAVKHLSWRSVRRTMITV